MAIFWFASFLKNLDSRILPITTQLTEEGGGGGGAEGEEKAENANKKIHQCLQSDIVESYNKAGNMKGTK